MEYVRVSENGGTPIAGWFIMEGHIRIWMMTGSTPIFFRKLPTHGGSSPAK